MRFRFLAAALAAVLAAPAAVQAQNNRFPNQGDPITRGSQVEDGVQVTAVGRVEAVRPDGGFTMVTRGNLSFTVYMPTAGLRRPGNERFSVGDRVRVAGELTGLNRIAAEDIDLLGRGTGSGRPSNTLTGTIRNINTAGQWLTLQTDRGTMRVEWDENTEWSRNRARETPRGFRVGDVVRVAARQRPGGDYVARRVVFGGTAGWENGGVGEIVSLNSRTRTAEVDFDGRVETVDLRNATLRQGNRRVEIDDLRLGFDVRIQGSRSGANAPIQATSVDVVRQSDEGPGRDREVRTSEGVIEEVYQDERVFRIRTSTGTEIRVELDRDTEIVRGTSPVAFNTLRRGQRVRVRGPFIRRDERNDVIRAVRVELL